MKLEATIPQLQTKSYVKVTCENQCNEPATHKDTRTGELLCQPHSFTVNRQYRVRI